MLGEVDEMGCEKKCGRKPGEEVSKFLLSKDWGEEGKGDFKDHKERK